MAHDIEKGQSQMKAATTSIKKSVTGAGQKSYSSHSSLAKGTATAPKKNL